MKKIYNVALIGNPNTGKSLIFNILAKEHQHVGNWPGVTVEKKVGIIYKDQETIVNLIDLPGIYSLNANSEDEKATLQILTTEVLDLVVIVLDASKLERSLYLYTQIKELNYKTIIALNMNDLAIIDGIEIDKEKLSNLLESPIVPIVAIENKNMNDLLNEILKEVKTTNKNNKNISKLDDSMEAIENRWDKISNICKNSTTRIKKNVKNKSDFIDKIVLNKYLSFPLFFLVMFLMFFSSYILAKPIVFLLEKLIEISSKYSLDLLNTLNAPELIKSFVSSALFGGIGTIIIFFPNILMHFLILGFLEDIGYLSRSIFIMDTLMRKIGLYGKSFISIIIGFGCTVPAMLSTKIIENKKSRLMTMLVLPFITCSAKLPVFILFTNVFFKEKSFLIMFLLYFISISLCILISKILSLTVFFKDLQNDLMIELPTYHKPSLKNILNYGIGETTSFLKKSFSSILISVVIIWILANLPLGVVYASQQSILGIISTKISIIFKFTGFGFWQASIALVSGLLAKESIISTLGAVLTPNGGSLSNVISTYFNKTSAFSFLLMVLLYTPCFASIITFKRESKSWGWTIFFIVFTFSIALIISSIFYSIAKLFFN